MTTNSSARPFGQLTANILDDDTHLASADTRLQHPTAVVVAWWLLPHDDSSVRLLAQQVQVSLMRFDIKSSMQRILNR